MPTIIGLAVFVILIRWALWAKTRQWCHLARRYPGSARSEPFETRSFQSGVLFGFGSFNSMNGIMTADVSRSGVVLRAVPPFSLVYPPLLIPYDEIQGWRTTWYLDAPSSELQFRNAPEVKMIVPADLAVWIQAHAGHHMTLNYQPPPQGRVGRGWRAFQLVHVALSVVMVTTLIAVMLWQHLGL